MIRAQIQRNNHTTNKKVIDIRQIELEYYQEFFNMFATISALLIGFTLNSLTNMVLDGSEKQSRVRVFADLYWVGCAATFATAIYTLFSTMLCNVFGPGLALRGPLGSMVKAVNGMFDEQHAILYSFVLSIVAFAIMMTVYFWMVMTTIGAATGTIIVFLSSFVWYHYCVRIVNRFQWNEPAISWSKADMPDALYRRGKSNSATGTSTMIQRDAGNGDSDYFSILGRKTTTFGYLSRRTHKTFKW